MCLTAIFNKNINHDALQNTILGLSLLNKCQEVITCLIHKHLAHIQKRGNEEIQREMGYTPFQSYCIEIQRDNSRIRLRRVFENLISLTKYLWHRRSVETRAGCGKRMMGHACTEDIFVSPFKSCVDMTQGYVTHPIQ